MESLLWVRGFVARSRTDGIFHRAKQGGDYLWHLGNVTLPKEANVNPTIVCSCTAEGMYTNLDAQAQTLAFSTGYIKKHKSMRTCQNPILHKQTKQ